MLFGHYSNLNMLIIKTNLICWSLEATDGILSKTKKLILQNFDLLALVVFLLYGLFSVLNKTKK